MEERYRVFIDIALGKKIVIVSTHIAEGTEGPLSLLKAIALKS